MSHGLNRPSAAPPTSLFSIVMGITGLGLAWRNAHLYGLVPASIAEILLLCGGILFGLFSLYCGYRLIKNRSRTEPVTPVGQLEQLSFAATVSLSLLLLAAAILPYSTQAAKCLWITGAAAQFSLGLATLSLLIRGPHSPAILTPLLFLPLAGNLLGPVSGIPLGFAGASWLMFTAGLISWLTLLVLLFGRLTGFRAIPAEKLPSMAIFITPPALAFAAYLELNHALIDFAGHLFFFAGLFFLLLDFAMIDRFLRIPFSIRCWSFSFPLAALAGAAFDYRAAIGSTLPSAIPIALIVLATVTIAILAVRSLFELYRARKAGMAGLLAPRNSPQD
jgi:tellurite resistance protein